MENGMDKFVNAYMNASDEVKKAVLDAMHVPADDPLRQDLEKEGNA